MIDLGEWHVRVEVPDGMSDSEPANISADVMAALTLWAEEFERGLTNGRSQIRVSVEI